MMNELTSIQTIPPPPQRPRNSHKGTFGTVIVVGGSPTMLGAPALCASGSLRSGAGLVKLAMSSALLPYAISIEPGATGIGLDGSVDAMLHALHDADPQQTAVLAVGPGLSSATWHGGEMGQFVMALLRDQRTMLLDADGLSALAQSGQVVSGRRSPLVLTPHPGEFARLAQPLGIKLIATDPAQRPAAAAELADAHQAIVVLKGSGTIVSDGRRMYENQTGNAALATAGSGDVLAGMISALCAQQMDPFDAAVLAVHVHGLGADLWARDHGPAGLTACDLATLLPDAFNALRREE